jgi:hypothetical protein
MPIAPSPSDMTRFATRYATVALRLVDHGWTPVPLHPDTKIPSRRAWPLRTLLSRERLRQEVLRELSWGGGADRSGAACGIVLPSNVVAIDCDLTDATANATTRRILHETLGAPRVARIGDPRKWLALYGAAQPVVSRKFGGIELFCGSGQIAAYGVHQKTRQPYLWSEIHPLNTRPEQLPRVEAEQVDAFIAALIAANVLQRASPSSSQRGNGHAGGRPAFAPSGRFVATERLHALTAECDGRVRPAIERLIREVGEAGCGRHDTIVAVAGVLVKCSWFNSQIRNFLVPLVNTSFRDGDWSREVELAVAHARNRTRLRRLAMEKGSPVATAATTRGAV